MKDPLASIVSHLRTSSKTRSTFEGIAYRSTTPHYAGESDLISGKGSAIYGGRWNPIGLATVYLSMTPETAMAETLAHYRYSGIGIEFAMPRVFISISTRLQSVLDLRIGAVRQRIRMSAERLLQTDWRKDNECGMLALTQILGRAAFDSGFEAIIASSAADSKGANLVVFPDRLQSGSFISVFNPSKSPGM